MPPISRADAEALVDGLTFTCAPVLARFADRPELLELAGALEESYNAVLRAKRETMIAALLANNEPDEAFAAGDRVMLAREMDGFGSLVTGRVWVPRPERRGLNPAYATTTDDWETAEALGLTADPKPAGDRPYVMVAWDDRPGALQVHYLDELRAVTS